MSHYLLLTSYPVLFCAVFANQLCIPIPGMLFLLAAGALCHSGQLSFPIVIGLSTTACLMADAAWYWAGRRHGQRVLNILSTFSSDPASQIRKAKRAFELYGLRSLLVAKFLPGLDAITPPLAGICGSGMVQFLAYDAIGAALWSTSYAVIGLAFDRQFNYIALQVSRSVSAITLIMSLLVGIYVTWHVLRFLRLARSLRINRIQPTQLWQKISSGAKVLVIDLLTYEAGSEDLEGIFSSVRVDPVKVREASHLLFPQHLEVVLYCRSQDYLRSTQIALVLRKHGCEKVRILDGGLEAWRKEGLPVTRDLQSPEAAFRHYGMRIDPRYAVSPQSV